MTDNYTPKDQVEATRKLLKEMNDAAGHGNASANSANEAADSVIDKTAEESTPMTPK